MLRKPLMIAAITAAAGAMAFSSQVSAHDPVAGALIGGGIGAAVAGPPGAAVGAILGTIIGAEDRRHGYDYRGPRYQESPYDEPRYPSQGYAPAPGYYAPEPAYYAPPPVYYAPPRYLSAPVYYDAPRYAPPRVHRAPPPIYRSAGVIVTPRHDRRGEGRYERRGEDRPDRHGSRRDGHRDQREGRGNRDSRDWR